MREATSDLNVRVGTKQRERFKKKCRSQGITLKYAVSQLIQKAIDDEVAISPVETKLVFNERAS